MTDISTLAAALEEAQQDLAMFRRLTSAEQRVAQLSKDYEKAKAAQDKAEADEAEAAHAARFNGLSDIRVTVSGKEPSLIHKSFVITWTQPKFTAWQGETLPTQVTCNGFAALPPRVFAYLVEEHPEQIPAEIMALAPGDPAGAIDAYLRGVRRGFFTGKVPA